MSTTSAAIAIPATAAARAMIAMIELRFNFDIRPAACLREIAGPPRFAPSREQSLLRAEFVPRTGIQRAKAPSTSLPEPNRRGKLLLARSGVAQTSVVHPGDFESSRR